MNILINNVNINYQKSGAGQPVILMHGWGQNLEMMYSIENTLKENYLVYNIDLPGFGNSDEPDFDYKIDDYVKMLEVFITENEIVQPIIIGHSFGCRIAIKYASYSNNLKSMILTGAAGVMASKSILYYIKVYTYKFFKLFKNVPFVKYYIEDMMNNSGSEDYRNSSNIMKGVLRNSVNEDLSPYLNKIKVPTLLVFGSNDQATPLRMAYIMEEQIPNAKLIIYKGNTHYAYLESQERFSEDVTKFLKEANNVK